MKVTTSTFARPRHMSYMLSAHVVDDAGTVLAWKLFGWTYRSQAYRWGRRWIRENRGKT